jgi:hypothetical protein
LLPVIWLVNAFERLAGQALGGVQRTHAALHMAFWGTTSRVRLDTIVPCEADAWRIGASFGSSLCQRYRCSSGRGHDGWSGPSDPIESQSRPPMGIIECRWRPSWVRLSNGRAFEAMQSPAAVTGDARWQVGDRNYSMDRDSSAPLSADRYLSATCRLSTAQNAIPAASRGRLTGLTIEPATRAWLLTNSRRAGRRLRFGHCLIRIAFPFSADYSCAQGGF